MAKDDKRFKGFPTVDELREQAYRNIGWTEKKAKDAQGFLDAVEEAGREFFARMAELQQMGRPAETQGFRVAVPKGMYPVFEALNGRPVDPNSPPPSRPFRVDAEGHLLYGGPTKSGILTITELVLGREGLQMPSWDTFDEYREDILEAFYGGMEDQLAQEASRAFLGR